MKFHAIFVLLISSSLLTEIKGCNLDLDCQVCVKSKCHYFIMKDGNNICVELEKDMPFSGFDTIVDEFDTKSCPQEEIHKKMDSLFNLNYTLIALVSFLVLLLLSLSTKKYLIKHCCKNSCDGLKLRLGSNRSTGLQLSIDVQKNNNENAERTFNNNSVYDIPDFTSSSYEIVPTTNPFITRLNTNV